MKSIICLLFFTTFFMGCSVQNRIVVTENQEEGLTRIQLVQKPQSKMEKAGRGIRNSLLKEASLMYLFEEKTNERSRMTLAVEFPGELTSFEADFLAVMMLDKEEIPLSVEMHRADSLQERITVPSPERLKLRYLLPENLWLSMVHSNAISYRFTMGGEATVHYLLDQHEMDMLSEFLNMAISQRDEQYPAVPEGQVKW